MSVNATRIDLQRAAEGAAQRDDRMQTTLEVVRTDQQIAMQQLPQLSGDFGSRVDALVALVRETRDLSSIIVSRADLIVQRMALPLESGILMHLPEGLIIAPSDDEALSAAIWQSGGRFEPGTLKVIAALVGEGDFVIDIGANIGLVTIPAARAVGSMGQVIAESTCVPRSGSPVPHASAQRRFQ